MISPEGQPQRPQIQIGRIVFPYCQRADGRFVAWYMSGSNRRRVSAVTMKKLRVKLEKISIAIRNGKLDVAELTSADCRIYMTAREAVQRHQVPLDSAAREYSSARDLLGDVPLLDAIKFYKRYAGVELIEKPLSQVVVEFLAAKACEGLSEEYERTIRKDLGRFSDAFPGRVIGDIRATDIEAFLNTVGHVKKEQGKPDRFVAAGAFRRNQVRNTIGTLFNFARAKHYLIQDRTTQVQHVGKRKAIGKPNAIFTPAQIRVFLEYTAEHEKDWLPWLATGAFAGIRTKTITRLEWSAFHWAQGLILVQAAKSKIGRRYTPPILPALAAWLSDWTKAHGPVCVHKRVEDFTERLAKKTGIPWAKNALRNSFISYRMAVLKDAAAVSLEANNSPRQIFQNYQEVVTPDGQLVTPELAEAWFGVMPGEKGNIIQAAFRF